LVSESNKPLLLTPGLFWPSTFNGTPAPGAAELDRSPTEKGMPRIVIRGAAAVFREDEQVTDSGVLRSLGGLVYDEERFTDYLGGPPEEEQLAAALEPGGIIKFGYIDGDALLTATTEYQSRRPLTEVELRLLVGYTMGQWSDGIGENWTCISPDKCGYLIMCLTAREGIGPGYPAVEVVAE
jgi:hypothetical protein